jgi:Leucine-rich repeat (LRR) protein
LAASNKKQHMKYSDIIEESKNHIKAGNLNKFFCNLEKYLSYNSDSFKKLLELQYSFNEIENKFNKGNITYEQQTSQKNRLSEFIIEFINKISPSDFYPISSLDEILKKFKDYEITIENYKIENERLASRNEKYNLHNVKESNSSELIWWNQLTEEWRKLFQKNIGLKPRSEEIKKMLDEQEFLDCRESKITQLFPLRNFKNLKFLDISYTEIDDLSPSHCCQHRLGRP